jgi:hypothetical protein
MTTTQLETPWIEKYRPKDLSDVVGNEEAIGRLRVIASEGNMPNLILSVTLNPQDVYSSDRDLLELGKQRPSCVWQEHCWVNK